MKLTKKLLPAIGMLMLSTAMMVTSSFAWFSMNTEVVAQNMQVTAKAEQVYLQIVEGDADFHATDAQTIATATNTTEGLTPTAVVKALSQTTKPNDTITAFDGSDIVWVTAQSDNPGQSNKAGVYQDVTNQVTDKDDSAYALLNTFKIRLNPKTGLQTANGPLRVQTVSIGGTEDSIRDAVSVLVVCGSNAALYKQSSKGVFARSGDEYLSANPFANPNPQEAGTDPNYVVVSVYVFFDGEHASCTSNNVTANAYDVDITFTCASVS